MAVFRSEKFRRLVASLPCQHCGIDGRTQAAHRNESKGMGLKTSDALVAALCADCHTELDSGNRLTRDERRDMWNRAYIKTVQALIEQGRLIINRSSTGILKKNNLAQKAQ